MLLPFPPLGGILPVTGIGRVPLLDGVLLQGGEGNGMLRPASRHCRPICEFNLGLSPRVFRTEGGELVVMDEQRQWHVCSLRVDE